MLDLRRHQDGRQLPEIHEDRPVLHRLPLSEEREIPARVAPLAAKTHRLHRLPAPELALTLHAHGVQRVQEAAPPAEPRVPQDQALRDHHAWLPRS